MMRPDDCWAAHWRLGNRSGGPARGGGARAVGGRSARPQGWDLVSALRPISSEHQIKSGAWPQAVGVWRGGGAFEGNATGETSRSPSKLWQEGVQLDCQKTMDPVEA